MGLRERKKRDTREAILSASRKLFLQKGYKAASMEKIAEASNVAVGTIYNYFSSKADVMVELNSRETEKAISRLAGLDMESASVEDLLWEVVSGILEVVKQYPRELMRELMAVTIENSRSSLASGLADQDQRFIKYIGDMINRLKEEGRVKRETDPDMVAFAIYSLTFGGIMLYTMDENTSLEDTGVLISGMIGQFFRGILPEGSG